MADGGATGLRTDSALGIRAEEVEIAFGKCDAYRLTNCERCAPLSTRARSDSARLSRRHTQMVEAQEGP